ncbi:MAG: C4-type zinc ribbon domain-containing protein [Chloroflexota bacterium]
MSRTGPLFDLQQIDTGLDTRVARMRQIDAELSDNPELVAAREQFEGASSRVAQEQGTLKQLSHDAEETSNRLRVLEKKMYDGSVKNPKELGQMQDEVTHLKARLKSLEERALDAMMVVDEVEATKSTAQEALDAATKEQELYHTGLLEEKDKLLNQAKVLQVKRQRAITELPWADLQMYERLRRAKGGVAVVAVRGGKCGGCHVAVTTSILRQARLGTDLVSCPTCGRILYPLGEVKYEEFDHNLDNVDR